MRKCGEDFWLHSRFLRKYKKNTIALFFCFSLTFLLMTVLLILLHTNFLISDLQAKTEFTPSDCYIDGLDNAQVENLRTDPDISWIAIEQGEGRIYTRNNQQAYLIRGDELSATMMAGVVEGRLPENYGEVAVERWVLLNLGIEPVIGQTLLLTDFENGKEEEFILTGILSDIYANKRYGLMQMHTGMEASSTESLLAYIKFKDRVTYNEKMAELQAELEIKNDSIKECPARTDYRSLYVLEAEIIGVVLIVCMVVFYGIYRIMLLTRLPQYGMLRAIGMKRKQLTQMVLLELYEIFFISVPVGTALGIGAAWLILRISGDMDQHIFLLGERAEVQLTIPWLAIGVCILITGGLVGGIGLVSASRAGKQRIIEIIRQKNGGKKRTKNAFSIDNAQSKNGMILRMGGKYLVSDLKTMCFTVLTVCVGVMLFTGLAYKARTLEYYRNDTKELSYLNGQYAMTMLHYNRTDQGISRENAEIIARTSGVSQVRTSSSLPVRVIDNKAVGRNEEYYDELNERQMEIYGYSDEGYDGKDQVYKSFLNGYNEEALRCLKPYIVEGDFDPENLKGNQIIVSVLRMDQRAGGGLPGPYKEGSPMMDYHAGDEIQIKYRNDFRTDTEEYENFSDTDAEYTYKTYKIAAVVSFPFMYDCRHTVYPLLITSDSYLKTISPGSAIQCMYLDGDPALSEQERNELEGTLIRLGSENASISTRSLIDEIERNEMFYFKRMVYITGIALVSLLLVIMNMTNTLRYRMQTRTKEISMLRAVGYTRRMIIKMLLFENCAMGAVGIMLAFILSWPVLKYLHSDSEMLAFGHSFVFETAGFLIAAAGALLVCIVLSFRVPAEWKTRRIADGIVHVE